MDMIELHGIASIDFAFRFKSLGACVPSWVDMISYHGTLQESPSIAPLLLYTSTYLLGDQARKTIPFEYLSSQSVISNKVAIYTCRASITKKKNILDIKHQPIPVTRLTIL
jgi:hypothetical protein